ncbi:LCP family protein [Eubacterium xylanophilum]|uniref:LCP family protein n=1 Tax=Eubacterium xylanophilum TaxID=39497 RepID=UPI0004BC3968|nr:LCP family protein [Eubacterium xylanophilum]
MKTIVKRKLSLVFLILQLLVTAGLIAVIVKVGFVPMKYIALVIGIGAFFFVYTLFSQMTNKSYIVGRILCVMMCGIYVFGGYYCVNTYSSIDTAAGKSVKVDNISCIVLKDDKAQSIYDTKDYIFGIFSTADRANTDKALDEVKAAIGTEPKTQGFEDNDTLVDALYAKEVNAIIINEASRPLIEEYYKTFSKDTRVLNTHKVETVIEEKEVLDDITQTPFNVYLSGIDIYGDINTTSRSDVNVIATVNPITKEILLTSTPRDYYVPLTISNGIPDKLTHAGIHGVDCSIGTLEKLYDIKIDYYVRVNFTSVRKIVNILGGVKVYSDFDFMSDWGPNGAGTHYYYKKGYNKVNGKEALAFCRERHHFANGDYQRGRDHQHMIEAVLNKAMSPKVLPNYAKLLKAVSENFQTNMKTKEIAALCKMQLNDMSQWKIKYANAKGSEAKRTTYAYQSRKLYVCVPDYDSVAKISKKIKKLLKAKEATMSSKSVDQQPISDTTGGTE